MGAGLCTPRAAAMSGLPRRADAVAARRFSDQEQRSRPASASLASSAVARLWVASRRPAPQRRLANRGGDVAEKEAMIASISGGRVVDEKRWTSVKPPSEPVTSGDRWRINLRLATEAIAFGRPMPRRIAQPHVGAVPGTGARERRRPDAPDPKTQSARGAKCERMRPANWRQCRRHRVPFSHG